jgi:hypothetical protein
MARDKSIKTMRVFPSSTLSPVDYVAGVGPDGADVPIEEAEAMLATGRVVKSKPKAPDSPAEKSEDKD